MTSTPGGPLGTCTRCTRAIDAGEPYVAITMQWERMRRKRISVHHAAVVTVRHTETLAYVHEECTEGLVAELLAAAMAGPAS